MHIPDGYLSPASCGVLYAAAVPFWLVAANKVKRILSGRTVPLLSIFAALQFAIMMFNVPVPGGTTAHGVGGTLVAIVLGPWAAVITTSVALVLQALFFGDGGITAIGANCFNMAIVLPITGYVVYRMVAGNSDVLSQRRVIAAAVGSYVGITVAALFVGIELGIQPRLWSTNGVPDYSPYSLGAAILAMLLSHMLGASFVEAAITALGVAYLQKSMPDVLAGGAHVQIPEGVRSNFNPLRPALAFIGVSLTVVFVAGMIKGSGHLNQWAGLDWTTVDWGAAAQTVLVSAVVSAIVMPILFILLKGHTGMRLVVMLFVGLMVWVPIGLIAPGGAFGEDTSATQTEVDAALTARASGDATLYDALPGVNRECDCVPTKINNVDFASGTILAGYQPPWVSENDAAWKQNLGYQVAGLAGMALFAIFGLGLFQLARWIVPEAPPDWRAAV